MVVKIPIIEQIALLNLAESYLIGVNYFYLSKNLPDYDGLIEEFGKNKLFRVHPIERGAIIVCNVDWVCTRMKDIADIPYKEKYKALKQSETDILHTNLLKYINLQLENTLLSKEGDFAEVKIALHSVQPFSVTRYYNRDIHMYRLSIIDFLNVLMIRLAKTDKEMYIRIKTDHNIQYMALRDFIIEGITKDVLHNITSALEPINGGTSSVVTLRIPLSQYDIELSKTRFI